MALHRTGLTARPAAKRAPHEGGLSAFMVKDLAFPDAHPESDSETTRLLQQSQDLLARLRHAVSERVAPPEADDTSA
ncbi:MAG: hypothetical protein OHK0029_12100 [Armatimonadaceae bacterium]